MAPKKRTLQGRAKLLIFATIACDIFALSLPGSFLTFYMEDLGTPEVWTGYIRAARQAGQTVAMKPSRCWRTMRFMSSVSSPMVPSSDSVPVELW